MDVVRVLLVDDQPAFLRAMAQWSRRRQGSVSWVRRPRVRSPWCWPPSCARTWCCWTSTCRGSTASRPPGGSGGRLSPPVVLLLSTYDEDAGEQFVAESGAAAYVTKSAFGPDRAAGALGRRGLADRGRRRADGRRPGAGRAVAGARMSTDDASPPSTVDDSEPPTASTRSRM